MGCVYVFRCSRFAFIAEQIIPRDKTWNYAGRGRRFRYRNATVDLIFLFGIDPWSVAIRLFVAIWVVGHIGNLLSIPTMSSLPVLMQIVLLTLFADGLRYWIHRLQHRTAWLWRFHALHHMPVNPVAVSTSRTHPFDDLITYMPETILFLLLGFSVDVVSGFYCVVWVIALISHANVDIAPGGWIAGILMHPRYHLAHHAQQSGEEPTFNFGEGVGHNLRNISYTRSAGDDKWTDGKLAGNNGNNGSRTSAVSCSPRRVQTPRRSRNRCYGEYRNSFIEFLPRLRRWVSKVTSLAPAYSGGIGTIFQRH
jgi:sterol desaturase/sphingolipid hydroxylase (fatty acid hydroxylase superfamily)